MKVLKRKVVDVEQLAKEQGYRSSKHKFETFKKIGVDKKFIPITSRNIVYHKNYNWQIKILIEAIYIASITWGHGEKMRNTGENFV